MIPITRLNAAPSVERVQRVLVHLHEDIRSNALANKDLDDITRNERATACIGAYMRYLDWIAAIFTDPARHAHISAQLAKVGWDESDVLTVHAALLDAVEKFDTSRDFDALLAAVQPLEADPETVWPE